MVSGQDVEVQTAPRALLMAEAEGVVVAAEAFVLGANAEVALMIAEVQLLRVLS